MAGRQGAVITVGSFDFPESVLLADIYGDALKAQGFPVRILPALGSRELVDPALMSGLIQLVPEYAGSALQFNSLGRLSATSNVRATSNALAELMADQGVVAGLPAAAQDANAIAVRAATADRYGLRSSRDVVARYGAGLMAVLNAVSARLGTVSLRDLDAQVEIHGQDPRQVADSWLRAHGLIPGGDVR